MPKKEESVGIKAVDASAVQSELTIVTVCMEKHFTYLPEQIALLDSLNPGSRWSMIVVDNSSPYSSSVRLDDPRCTVVAGVPADPEIPDSCRGSYHHAAALNAVMKQVRTRYALVLDPDLFVVYKRWIPECLQHLDRNGLSFFGVSWHPRWYRKERYVPCVHFLLIDLEKVPAAKLDFTPAILETTRRRETSRLDALIRKISKVQHARWLIHATKDTGWRLSHDFPDRARAFIRPVVEIERELAKPKHLATEIGRSIERMLPRRWSFLPARGTYVTPRQSAGFDIDEIRSLGPEKFIWRGAPFAFHLRGQIRELVDGRVDREREWEVLKLMLARVADSRPWFEWAN